MLLLLQIKIHRLGLRNIPQLQRNIGRVMMGLPRQADFDDKPFALLFLYPGHEAMNLVRL